MYDASSHFSSCAEISPAMASVGGDAKKSLTQWLGEKGFDEEAIRRMSKRCRNLPNLDAGEASGVWDYLLNDVKIEHRKLRPSPGRSRRPSSSSRR
uniref:Uncharacterized protein n=1 Tax=Aegilops tauschii subsp. strangulata TaxID=200361 RepID=A0A453RK80_AEGTS